MTFSEILNFHNIRFGSVRFDVISSDPLSILKNCALALPIDVVTASVRNLRVVGLSSAPKKATEAGGD